MNADLDAIMRKVNALLALADDPASTPGEAESARAKADAMMFKYKIETLTAPAQTGVSRPVPVWKTIWVCRLNNEWRNYYSGIASRIIQRNDSRANQDFIPNEEDGHMWLVYNAVGYEGDLRYAEELLAHAIAEFGKRLEPKFNPAESMAENALRLRQGGMERRRIAMLLFGGWETENEMKAKNRKVTRLIQEADPVLAKELLGRGTNIKTYRVSYANGFYHTLLSRLVTHRLAEGMAEHGLVLTSAKDAVDEAFYARYPMLRPKADDRILGNPREECARCKAAKSGYCREHQWLKPSQARHSTPYSTAGAEAGRAAARTVDFGRVGTGTVGQGDSRPAIS